VEIGPREGFGGPQPTIILSGRKEPEKGKSRLHIDVNATGRDQDAELERPLTLGARPADIGRTGEEQWHVLADPEGNELCLLTTRLAPLRCPSVVGDPDGQGDLQPAVLDGTNSYIAADELNAPFATVVTTILTAVRS